MKKGWHKVNMRELAEINPESISKNFNHPTIEYIDISSVGTGILLGTEIMNLKDAPSRAKRLVKSGDTILSTVRPNRRSFLFIKKSKPNLVVSTGFAVLRAKQNTNYKYLYYLINDQKFSDYLTACAKGAAYPAVDIEIIERGEFIVPFDENEQSKIASILSNYDDFIENNSRRIQLLESMAKLVYDGWFVKFKFPGHEKVKMVDSELEKIPEGWEVKKLGALGDFKNGINYLRDDVGDKTFSIVNVRNISNSRYLSTGSLDSIDVNFNKAKEYLLKSKDIIIARSACPGEVSILIDEKDNVIYSGFSIRYKLQTPENYLFVFLSLQKLKDNLMNFSTGTALKSVNQDTLKNMKILMPNEKVMKSFIQIIEPIFNQLRGLNNPCF